MKPAAVALSALDAQRLSEANALAEAAVGLSDPNPRVGCVIGRADGSVLGRGHTQAAGEAHAEVMAMRDAAEGSHDIRGATAWVTLEPCAHHGRTAPCCDALIAAGIARVVAAAGDPNPEVDGRGFDRLRAAGIDVFMAGGDFAETVRELNIGFFSRMQRGKPWVRAKVAVSLDGRTALSDGRSQWITGEAARRDGHAWRRRAGVVLTGIGTVVADNPRLDVRLVPTAQQPVRAVVDSRLRLPTHAQLLRAPGLLVFTAEPCTAPAALALLECGAEIISLPDGAGGVELSAVLTELGARGMNEVHVEAGPTLNGRLFEQSLVDEWLIYMAPTLLGDGMPLARILPPETPSAAMRLHWREVALCGGDLRMRLRLSPE